MCLEWEVNEEAQPKKWKSYGTDEWGDWEKGRRNQEAHVKRKGKKPDFILDGKENRGYLDRSAIFFKYTSVLCTNCYKAEVRGIEKQYKVFFLLSEWAWCTCRTQNMESRLEKTFKIIDPNHKPNTDKSTTKTSSKLPVPYRLMLTQLSYSQSSCPKYSRQMLQ